jgi:hypothetical protein
LPDSVVVKAQRRPSLESPRETCGFSTSSSVSSTSKNSKPGARA